MSEPPLSWPQKVVGLFLDSLGVGVAAQPGKRLTYLPYSVHLTSGAGSRQLFPAGPLDVLCFHQRHHASVHHEVEYVSCLPERSPDPEAFLAYGVFKLTAEEQLPLLDLNQLARQLQQHYGEFVQLPRARPLLERQYGSDLNDGDPPEGLNRVQPPAEEARPGRMTVDEVLDVLRAELSGQELVSWLEGAFRQRPPQGTVEHRYYLDAAAQVYLVRDHFREGKTLYRAETSRAALAPIRFRRRATGRPGPGSGTDPAAPRST